MDLAKAIRFALADVEQERGQFTAKYPNIPTTPQHAVGIGNLGAMFSLIADGTRGDEPGWEELEYHLKVSGTVGLAEAIVAVFKEDGRG